VKTASTILLLLSLGATRAYSRIEAPRNLMSPPAAQTDSTITLLWDKPLDYSGVRSYEVYRDGKLAGTSTRCNFRASGLAPQTTHAFFVKAVGASETSNPSDAIQVSTQPAGRRLRITDFGAIGDGTTTNTKAIQAALDDCPANGTVIVPAGTFVTGALFVRKSNLTLFLSEGAVLKGTHDLSAYPMIKSRYEGYERETCASILNCGSLSGGVTNIAIRGPGTIDCQGSYLSRAQTDAMNRSVRSHGLLMLCCTNIYLEGFTIQDSPTWCIHPVYCAGLTTEGVTIKTDGYGVPNADGWDPDSSTECYLFNSTFNTHDDDIAIKSGADAQGRKIGRPAANIRVTDCRFNTGGGFALGSEMSGGISNVFVQDCHFVRVDRGFNFKTRRGRGGVIQNIVIKDCTAEHFGQWGFNFEMHYIDHGRPAVSPDATPILKDFHFENIVIDRVTGPAILMNSLPESPISNVTYQNVTIKDADKGCAVTHCDRVSFRNFHAAVRTGPLWNLASDNQDLVIVPPAAERGP
jgi:exo-poly-alpha-galacturonosidase